MDRRLLEAAQKGDVARLNELIGSNPRILEEAALKGDGPTPLHIACDAGHSNFVRELLKSMPALAEKVDAGFSPLHIAAAGGDVETVREILNVCATARGDVETASEILNVDWPRQLCLVKGVERWIPLHYAAANGKVDAMKELLSASPESVKERTAREETALHLAVKYNRFDAFVVLVKHLKQQHTEQVINWKDKNGDTVLHLATAAKNFEVVNFILSGRALELKVMEVNAWNKSGLTPLDVLPRSVQEIRGILVRAGAKHRHANSPSYQSVVKTPVRNNHPQPAKGLNQGQESLGNTRNALLVVAALIATVTYQVLLQPPGFAPKADSGTKKGLLATYASFMTSPVMRYVNYLGFVTGNTLGFFVSVQMIICLTRDLPLKLPLRLSMAAMVYTYLCLMWYMPFSDAMGEKFSLISEELLTVLPVVITVFLLLIQGIIAKFLDIGIKGLGILVRRLPWIDFVEDMYGLD